MPQPQAPSRAPASRSTSPRDHLDQLVHVTRPHLWIGIAGVVLVVAGLVVWAVLGTVDTTVAGQGLFVSGGGTQAVPAPADGLVTHAVEPGTHVEAGGQIAIVESADGDESPVKSPIDGTLLDIPVTRGEPIAAGNEIAILAPDGPLSVVAFVPLAPGKSITAGMSVQVSPSTVPSASYGYVVGSVARVSPYPVSADEIAARLNSEALAAEFADEGPALELTVSIQANPANPTGLQWSSGTGPATTITVGTPAEVTVITASQHPVSYMVGQ